MTFDHKPASTTQITGFLFPFIGKLYHRGIVARKWKNYSKPFGQKAVQWDKLCCTIISTTLSFLHRARTLFQRQFSRTLPGLLQDSDTFFQVTQMNSNWRNNPLRNRNPKIILQPIPFKPNFYTRVYKFQGLSRTFINFPGLEGPGKLQNKISGLFRISRTRTNPDYNNYIFHKGLTSVALGYEKRFMPENVVMHGLFINRESTAISSWQ